MMNLIILAGMPATGKSTIAKLLTEEFHYPILEKDNIKEALFDTIGFGNYAQKRKLDVAANEVLLHVLEAMLNSGSSVIVDNNFDKDSAGKLNQLINIYHPHCVCVFLNGDEKALYKRYVERDNLHLRHLGHILQEHYPPLEKESMDYTMTPEEFHEKFFDRGMADFQCPGERIELDVTDFGKVDVNALINRIKCAGCYPVSQES